MPDLIQIKWWLATLVKFLPHHRRTKPHRNHNVAFCTFALVSLLFVSTVRSQQPSGTQQLHLSKIEVVGLHRYTHEQVVDASGLWIGQNVTIEMLDEAAGRMANSGLFKRLSYRVRGVAAKAIVIFEIEEFAGGAPVIFDNFVWLGEDELVTAIKRELPTFDGTAPEAGGAMETIVKALQRLLDERKIAGKVEYTPSADLAGGNAKQIVSVKGLNIPICALTFPGATEVKESELVQNSNELYGSDYSREFVASFAEKNLKPIYRERGHLRAAFYAPTAKPESNPKCKDGANVTVQVEEGVVYAWESVEWSGNQALSAEELTGALGMKSGELANGLKIDKGFGAVRDAYGTKGYLATRAVSKPTFDDATKRVTFIVSLSEGPQFRMGDLVIAGFPEVEAKNLKDKWKLKTGEVYNAAYLEEFMKEAVRGLMTRLGPGAGHIRTDVKPDREKLTVAVTISLKK